MSRRAVSPIRDSRLSRWSRPLVALLGAGALVGAGAAAVATAPPQRLLQSVGVSLGADGSIADIHSVNVVKQSGGDVETKDKTYAPVKTASKLPVRISTGYRTAKATGTDLSDLKGYTGRVQIDITVQNTTVAPHELTYDSLGRQITSTELVGVPLTVSASADLGKDTTPRVVTTTEDGSAVTNGVLSRDQDDHGVVQWAAVLAPPQLSSTATFTLVENAHDFKLEDLSIGVQPGLASSSDPAALVQSAFSPTGNTDLALQRKTIEMIGNVTTVLASAGTQLGKVRSQLDYSTDTLGSQTISNLNTGLTSVSTSATQLSNQLNSFGDSLTNTLKNGQSATLSAVSDSLDDIKASLGDPNADTPATTAPAANGCAPVDAKGATASSTVLGQVARVTALLNSLSSASDACGDKIRASLKATIGTVDASGNAQCSSTDTSAVCTLDKVADNVTALGAAVGTTGNSTTERITDLPIKSSIDIVKDVIAKVTTLQQDSNDGASAADQAQRLETIRSTLVGLLATNGANSLPALSSTLSGLSQTADTQAKSLTTDSNSVQQQILAVGNSTCKAIADHKLTIEPAELAILQGLTTGQGCAGAINDAETPVPPPAGSGYSKSLLQRVKDDATQWSTVSTQLGAASSTINSIVSTLTAKRDEVIALSSASTTLSTQLANADAQVDALYDASEAVPSNCATIDSAAMPTHSLNRALAALNKLNCSRDAAQADVSSQIAELKTRATSSGAAARAALGNIDAQRQLTDDEVKKIFADTGKTLTDAGSDASASSKSLVSAQRKALDGQYTLTKSQMDKSFTSAVKSITGTVSSSSRDVVSASNLTSATLKQVLANLGTRSADGKGLLGIIAAQEAQTATSMDKIGKIAGDADGFGSVRSIELDSIFQQQAALTKALDLQASYPAFGTSLPNGSEHVSVYTFSMAKIG